MKKSDIHPANLATVIDIAQDDLMGRRLERGIEQANDEAWAVEQKRRKEEEARREEADRAEIEYLNELPAQGDDK